MKKIHMVMADKDEDYIHRLARWFIENMQKQFRITAFTEKGAFDRFMNEKNEDADVVLISSDFLTESRIEQSNIIVLDEPATETNAKLRYIHKYQSAPAISSEILSIVSEWGNQFSHWSRSHQNGTNEIIVCYSPDPALKSTLALCLSARLENSLYLNTESFPFYSLFPVSQTNRRSLSDVLYHIKASRGNLELALESTVCTDSTGIHFIPEMDNPKDFLELSEEETGVLTEALLSWERFQRIIADIAFHIGSYTTWWLDAASKIFVPLSRPLFHQCERIYNMLQHEWGGEMEKVKFVCCENPGSERIAWGEKLYTIPGLDAFPSDWKSSISQCSYIQRLDNLLFDTDMEPENPDNL